MATKLLSLDGGATWAMVQARVLRDIYGNISGHQLLKQFDFVIATSGGSVLLGLLCSNYRMDDILDFYKNPNKLRLVFPKFKFWERIIMKFLRRVTSVGPKYATNRKLKGLEKAFRQGAKTDTASVFRLMLDEMAKQVGNNYQESLIQFLITAFDYETERAVFFRSNLHSKTAAFSNIYYRVGLGEAIHASTNAPVNYYDLPACLSLQALDKDTLKLHSRSPFAFWDGAIGGFNNPVLAGAVEVITNLDVERHGEIYILSIGTGLIRNLGNFSKLAERYQSTIRRTKRKLKSPIKFDFAGDIKKVSASILSDPPDSASFIVSCFLNPSLKNETNTIVRINPVIEPLSTETGYTYPQVFLENKSEFRRILDLDFDVVESDELHLIEMVCDKFILSENPCVQNQLIRGEANAGVYPILPFLGFSTYGEAKSKWMSLSNHSFESK
jgi:hypothetical protein